MCKHGFGSGIVFGVFFLRYSFFDIGLATAAGCQLVASCDIAIATEKSAFATPG